MKTHLKVRAMTLAAQNRVLKRLLRGNKLPHIELHREFDKGHRYDKASARAVNVAYGFLRGHSLDQIERPYRARNMGHVSTKGLSRSQPNWDLVEMYVKIHGPIYFDSVQDMSQKFAEFIAPAVAVNEEPEQVAA